VDLTLPGLLVDKLCLVLAMSEILAAHSAGGDANINVHKKSVSERAINTG
jgi:hypothetical protein